MAERAPASARGTATIAHRSPAGTGAGTDPPRPTRPPHRPRRWRLVAALLGGLGAVLALAFPFLPVVQDTATITWPSPTTGTRPVDAPLVAYRPQSMTAAIPCAAITSLDARSAAPAVLLSTTPPLSPQGPAVGMRLDVADGRLTLVNRGVPVTSGPVPPGPCTVAITSDDTRTTVDLGSVPPVVVPGDERPQVVGIYSDLDAARDPVAGTAVSITTDTRFQTSPTVGKLLAGGLAVLATVGAVGALHGLDVRAGHPSPRRIRRRRPRPSARDAAVTAVLAVWAVIGTQTSDDGYILGIARARASSGYIGNYYRWFDVPEAPFGWFYEFYAAWAHVSDAVLWLRLPSVALGVASWLLIDHGLLPRLGARVRDSAAASWAAAGVFLLFWLAYDSGLRPEPVVVLAGLVALLAVERAVATRRLAPVALGLAAAGFALAATPTGLMAFAPFLVAARPLLRVAGERLRADGALPVLLPMAAAGLVVVIAVFADQTWAAVAEADRVRFVLGPNLYWFDEIIRYQRLLSIQPDGSLARRVPVLLFGLGLIAGVAALLRRHRIHDAALGPARRLLGCGLVGFVVLLVTPTKWTHHFGAFAALGAGVAALTVLATSSPTVRSPRNRSIFLAGLFVTLALAFAGPNAWWYTNDWGVPWFDKAVSVRGWPLSTMALLVAAGFGLHAAVLHLRGAATPRPPTRRHSPALAVVTGVLVLFEVASLAKGADKQAGSFSLGGDVLAHPVGGSCGLADDVLVDGTPLAAAVAGQPGFLEWPVQFASPCLRPFDLRDGIAEVPTYRLVADPASFQDSGDTWSQASAGGPLGWIEVLARPVDVPATLRAQPDRDWGALQRLDPYDPGAVAPTVTHGERVLWGATTQGEIGAPPSGVSSSDR